ncbi:MAG: HlyD family efflux transporter periplasmic adaptor subunit [Bryobacteraceae bacterium]
MAFLLLLVWVALIVGRRWTANEAGPTIPGRLLHARKGRLEDVLRVSGTLSADRAVTLLAPRMSGRRSRSSGSRSDFQIILQRMARPGEMVKPGDFLAEFDRQYMLSRLDDYRADRDQRVQSMKRVEANIAIRRKVLDQRMLVAKGNVEKARLNMKTLPVRSAIQAEHFRLQLEEAEAQLREIGVEARYFDASERAELRRQQLLLAEESLELRRAEANAARMLFAAPMGGIVVPARIRRGQEYGEVEPGDEVRSGYPFLQVMDPASLVLNASLNQVDADRVQIGMKARIYVDAIAGVTMPARVTAIGSLAVATRYRPDWVRSVAIKVTPERQDPRVFPNFSGSADLILRASGGPEGDGGVIVARECVARNATEGGRVRVWDGERAHAVDVGLGMASATEVAVTEGLRGDERLLCGQAE